LKKNTAARSPLKKERFHGAQPQEKRFLGVTPEKLDRNCCFVKGKKRNPFFWVGRKEEKSHQCTLTS